uniref:Uncharacterized protein n=1 Tax=Anguilla anguilla TaxID=7936 RepID=A0A0E9QBL4_ANGAN
MMGVLFFFQVYLY